MTFLIPLLLRAGIPSRFGKAVAWVVTILLAFAIVVGGVLILHSVGRSHDEAIATEAEQDLGRDITAEAYNMYVVAAEKADANLAARDETDAANAKEIDREAAKGDDATVGPGTAAVLARMRDQQAAGRR